MDRRRLTSRHRPSLRPTQFCCAHGGGSRRKRCEEDGCSKGALDGTGHCIAHGGGRRCQKEGGCLKAANAGGTRLCVAHGGGRRCEEAGCSKGAEGGGYCKAHGGGRRCQHVGCPKAATSGGTQHCQAHGGGKRCRRDDCFEMVARAPGSTLCPKCLRDTPPQLDGVQAPPPAAPDYTELLHGFAEVRRFVDENPQAWSSLSTCAGRRGSVTSPARHPGLSCRAVQNDIRASTEYVLYQLKHCRTRILPSHALLPSS